MNLNATLTLALTGATIGATLWAIFRGWEVRLVLLFSALLLGLVAGDLTQILDHFLKVAGDEKIIGPICTAMGFAFVIRQIGADQQMVQILLTPVRRMKWGLIPAGIILGYVANSAITSQTAAAAAVGPVLIPLMVAAGWSLPIAGLTLLLGCSLGGNILNPGEADVVAITKALEIPYADYISVAFLPAFLSLLILVFSSLAFVKWRHSETETSKPPITIPPQSISLWKAILPVLPLTLMLVLQPQWTHLPWIESRYPSGLPVSHVMIFCLFLALIIERKNPSLMTRQFFEGMGQGYYQVITLIITASCFIRALEIAGFTDRFLNLTRGSGVLSVLSASLIPGMLAMLSGSGTAPCVSFAQLVLPQFAGQENLASGIDLGVMAAIASSIGRTLSPVAAIVLFTSSLTEVPPRKLVKLAIPIVIPVWIAITVWFLF